MVAGPLARSVPIHASRTALSNPLMILTLLAVSLNDQALSRPITARFDSRGGTIGRADHSTMALPDPERVISRKQAEVVFMGDGYMIRNLGAANPITVAGRPLAQGETALLRDADEVGIGSYRLRVQLRLEPPPLSSSVPSSGASPDFKSTPGFAQGPVPAAAAAAAPAPEPAPYVPPAQNLSSSNPFADLLGAATPASDPFADLLGSAAPAAASDPFAGMMAAPAGLGARSNSVAPAAAAAPRLPDDFDPFAPPQSKPTAKRERAIAPPPPPPSTPPSRSPSSLAAPADERSFSDPAEPAAESSADPFAGLLPAAGAVSIDSAFGLAWATPGNDPLARFTADLAASPPAAVGGLSTDPLHLFGGASPAPAPFKTPQRDDLPALHGAFTPPRVQVATPAPAPVPPMPRTPPRAVDPGDDEALLWQAFCEGSGVRLPLPPGQGAERLRAIGRVFRAAVSGTQQLMAVRASTKHEMRADVTQIQALSNNPLKFAPDAATGIEQLVQPPTRGFLDGPAAMEDAMHDLVGHSIGTVAGMRAAIEGMLDRFDPAALERKLGAGSMLDSLLPMNRKARLWELYLQHHRSIREEAQEDFHTLFGKAFIAAYEQQVNRLKSRSPP